MFKKISVSLGNLTLTPQKIAACKIVPLFMYYETLPPNNQPQPGKRIWIHVY